MVRFRDGHVQNNIESYVNIIW